MKILISSLRFAPGHIAHLIAYYKMCRELNFDVKLLVDAKYLYFLSSYELSIITSIEDAKAFSPTTILVYNVAKENLTLANEFKKRDCKMIYVFHEPFSGFSGLMEEKEHLFRSIARMCVDSLICYCYDQVLLPSQNAKENYEKNMLLLNKNYALFPLIFPDEYGNTIGSHPPKREYFSYIGGFASTHGADEFLEFIHFTVRRKLDVKFKIATRTNLDSVLKDSALQDIIENGRLAVIHGKPLTSKEINRHYAESMCIWNVYNKSVQSGVLGNAFMMGTPVIASRIGSFEEYVIDGYNGFFIEDSRDLNEIYNAYMKIVNQTNQMEKNVRKTFVDKFYYKSQEDKFVLLAKSIT